MNLSLFEFSVVLLADSNNPSILNPDFLRYTGIVKNPWQILDVPDAVISIPGFSQVKYNDGLTIRAEPNRVVFEQTGDPLELGNISCIEMARHYLDAVPHVKYGAIGINPKGYKTLHSAERESVSNALKNSGDWMEFKNVNPEIQLKAIYDLNDKRIVLDVSQARKRVATGSDVHAIIFQANIHRDITESEQPNRIDKLVSVLNEWETDLSDFQELVNIFMRIK